MNLKEAVAKIVREALERAQPDDDAKKLTPLLGDMKLDASNEIDEAHGWIDPKTGQEVWPDEDDADIRDLYLEPGDFNEKLPSKDDRIVAKPKREADVVCEACGGTKNEGTCECVMTEGDPVDDEGESWLSHIASKVKKLAMKDVGGPQGVFTSAERIPTNAKTKKSGPSQDFTKWQAKQRANESVLRRAITKIVREVREDEDESNECPECGGPPGKHDPKCPHAGENPPVNESLRDLISGIVKEMKLGVAGGGHFDFSQKSDDDDNDIASFLLSKKAKEEEVPSPKKSGTKLSTSRHRSKSSKFR